MKVVVLGNGETALKKERGKLIDSFDIVIRCNECLLKGYEECVGTKTDIITVPSNAILKKIASKVGRTETENYIQHVNTVWYTRPKYWVEKITKCSEIAGMTNIINFEHICNEDFNKIVGQFRKEGVASTWPSTGLVAILRAVTTYPDYDIYVTGFDGFETGHYFKDEKKHHDSITKPIGDDHSREGEKKFFETIIKQHNIKVL